MSARYICDELVARGGMAEVHRGYDTRLGRLVAIKRLRPEFAGNPTLRVRLYNEARSVARLRHPAIVDVYDTGQEKDPVSGLIVPFIVMEFVEGLSLDTLIKLEGRLDADRALCTAATVLDALACSHAEGIVHRDIKPANVMFASTGQVKVTDFGIARQLSDGTVTGTLPELIMGTPQYMSPEQVRGSHVDARSDLYSVGCLLYELLTGGPPFTGDSVVTIAYHHVAEDPVPPGSIEPALGADIDPVVLRALAKDPADRYPSAVAMRAAIDRLLQLPRRGPRLG